MFMIMFVLDDIKFTDAILESWSNIGVSGATIIESSGLHRHLKKVIPMRYVFESNDQIEKGNLTFFVIVESEILVNACLNAIESIVGNLDNPNTGVFSAWPLSIVKGIHTLEQKER